MTNQANLKKHRPQLGDIFRIQTANGYFYIQYVNFDKIMGFLMRLIKNHNINKEKINQLTDETSYFFFYSLSAAIRRGDVEFVANTEIPNLAKNFPIMKHLLPLGLGTQKKWEIIYPDGRIEHTESLSKLQQTYSEYSLVGHLILKARIESNWMPGNSN